jgi:hypothetical protein
MKWVLRLFLCSIVPFNALAQAPFSWDSVLWKVPELARVASHPNKFKLQIICTKVDHASSSGRASFQTTEFNVEDSSYFYPASIVKLPASIFACEKIQNLREFGVEMETELHIDSSFQCQSRLNRDTYTNDSTASIAEFVEKALVVSDNPSYSRLYEFVGPEYFAQRFSEMNMSHASIRHRFSSCDSTANRRTNPFHFIGSSGDTIYTQPSAYFQGDYLPPNSSMLVGKSNKVNGKVEKKPKSFEKSNMLSLSTMHALMMELIYPESQPFEFHITDEQRAYLRSMLTISPRSANNQKIATNKEFHDNYTNYIFYGQENKKRESALEVCNIVGLAYGFMTDVCYAKDPESGTEFFLSATLYLNESNSFGSGNYQYSQIGFPFMKSLGWTIKSELEEP